MADRRDFYFRQRVTEGELDDAFDGLENALWQLAEDVGMVGIIAGATPTENAPPDLSILLDGPSTSYDKLGRRVYFGAQQTVDCSIDENGVSTAVANPGNERWVSVFLEFDRVLADERVDGASQQVWFERNEGFQIVVRQGAEAAAGLGVRPALDSGLLLVGDILLTNGQVQILNGDIDTTRREAFVVFSAAQISASTGGFTVIGGATVQAALASADAELASLQVADTVSISRMDDHVNGLAERHPATDVDTAVGGWSRLSGADTQAALDEVDADLTGLEELLVQHFGGRVIYGGTPTDGGGLNLNVGAASYISNGSVYKPGAQVVALPDNDVTWVYFFTSSISTSGFASSASSGAAAPIAKVTTVGGVITEIVDLRIIMDDFRKAVTVRVGSDNSAHFSKLSDAVARLEEWRSIYTLVDYEVELVGVVAESDAAKLPITFLSSGWRIRGLTNSRLECQVALTTPLIQFVDVDDIVIEDVDIRFTTGTAPSAAGQERFTFYGSNADRVVLRRITQYEFVGIGEGVHGFLFFDETKTCDGWLVEDCIFTDGRDFAVQVPSPNTGGQGVLTNSVFRNCRFQQHSNGARWIPTHGIAFYEGADILVDNCEIRDFDSSGVTVGNVDAARRVRVINCRVRDVGGYGITFQGNAQQCHAAHNDISGVVDPDDGFYISGDYNFVGFNHIAAVARYGVNVPGQWNVIIGNQSRGTGNNIGVNNTAANNADDV